MKEKIVKTELTDNQIALFYTGQEGFIIKYKRKYILIDGYLSDYVDKNCSTQNVKWIRKYPSPICAEELDFIDFVICSHAHFDHADPETLSKISKVNTRAKYIVPKNIAETISSYGIGKSNIIEATADKEIIFDEIKITPIPAAHEEINYDEEGNCNELGFIIKLGETKIYHAGDSCIYNGLENRLQNIDIAMLPINGRDYYKLKNNIIGNMNMQEAVTLSKNINAKFLIPMHFDLYDINCVSPSHFVDTIYKINSKQAFHIFVPGERYIFEYL